MKLIIVESPTKAKTLSRYLGGGYVIEASMGHLRDLPKSKLGVDVEHQFEPVYEVTEGRSKVISKLKKEAKTAEAIYLATDPDREGEAISWHVKYLLQENGQKKTPKIPDAKFSRVTFHEITKTAIEKALLSPQSLNLALVDAQQARRVVDRLVGYTLSPVLWKKVRRGLSAGRVQSVAVRLIVERETEIKAFKPQEYWEIKVELENGKQLRFIAELTEIDGKKVTVKPETTSADQIYLETKVITEPILEALRKAVYAVENVEKKERVRRAYPPYTTSTLQQAAANVLGMTARDTMRVAQELYEKGLITYHRTDSTNLANEAVMAARDYILKTYGTTYLPEQPVLYKTTSKNAQEAHEAVRPTQIEVKDLGETENGLSEKHHKLYRLIWQRFMGCQMKPAIYDQTAITVLGDKKYRLKANGSVMKFMGWRAVYDAAEKNGEVLLPEVTAGEPLNYVNLTNEQKFTQPPPKYNDASLVKELEKRGIGRPSTYASIITTIVSRGYVERLDRRLSPTAVGETVVTFLLKNFPDIMDYDFTAQMENDLDLIATGDKEWRKVMGVFWKPFKLKAGKVEETAKRSAIPVEETGEICPECKIGKLVIRSGRFGKFISCNRFPECKYTASYTQKVEGFPCPLCGGDVVIKRTKKGRRFWGCSNYPKCDWASWQDPRPKAAEPAATIQPAQT